MFFQSENTCRFNGEKQIKPVEGKQIKAGIRTNKKKIKTN